MQTNKSSMAKIAINKSLLKEYSIDNERVVYLNDGDEFQIQFFNPTTSVIGASFSVNGSEFSNYLILRPGERVWLERFIDSNNKFLFSTYEVGTSEEVKRAIQKNGEIKVRFYRKKERNPVWINAEPISVYYNNSIQDFPSYNVSLTALNAYAENANCSYSASTVTTSDSFCSTSYDPYETSQIKASAKSAKRSIETGRVEKGEHSNQNLDYVSGYEFEYSPFVTETIHLYPKSTKPVYKSDLLKKYCPSCGRKVSPKHKYCAYCGEKLN